MTKARLCVKEQATSHLRKASNTQIGCCESLRNPHHAMARLPSSTHPLYLGAIHSFETACDNPQAGAEHRDSSADCGVLVFCGGRETRFRLSYAAEG